MSDNNKQNVPMLKSLETLNRKRKESLDGKVDGLKLPNLTDLDVSEIENKPIHATSFSKTNPNQTMLSPFLRNVHASPPTNNLFQPPQPNPNKQSQQPRKLPPNRQAQSEQNEKERSSSTVLEEINWRSLWLYLKLIFLSYQFNLPDYLRDIDEQVADKVVDLFKLAPGFKPIQYVYGFYTFKYGVLVGILATIIYPLPYSILFLFITVDLPLPFVAIFMLAGMRSGAIALLLKYCLHFPKHIFHWIVLIFTILIGIFLPNNYIYLLLFAISIFLSFYLKNESSPETSPVQDEPSREQSNFLVSGFGLSFNEEQIYKEYKVYDNLPFTFPGLSIGILAGSFLLMWILQKTFDSREISIFAQMIPISMLTSSKEMLAFFPYLYQQTIGESTLSPNTLISLSFLFPGPHTKPFMFFIYHTQFIDAIIGYLCLYLPSILLANIFVGYRPHFFTTTYYNIRQSIQAVGNGIVFCLVFWMLWNEPCFFNSICYSAVVIMVVAKLYKLRQLFAITLGIFLISTRTIILNVNKNVPFEVQACLQQKVSEIL